MVGYYLKFSKRFFEENNRTVEMTGIAGMPNEEELVFADPQWRLDSPHVPENHWLRKLTNTELLAGLKTYRIEYGKVNSRAKLQETFLKAAGVSKRLRKLIGKSDMTLEKLGFKGINTRCEDELLNDVQDEEIQDVDEIIKEEENRIKLVGDFLEKEGTTYPNIENVDVSDCLNLMNEAADGLKQALEPNLQNKDASKLVDNFNV